MGFAAMFAPSILLVLSTRFQVHCRVAESFMSSPVMLPTQTRRQICEKQDGLL